jgi:acyl transferase domain-containing protein
MRKTYAQAGLNPAETRFFEAHGTGTPAGDPIEAGAISEMFTKYRSPEEPLYIGAVKSNIGHSEGASGITSVIKGILTLENGIIPANVHFEKRNSKIPDEWNLFFPTKAVAWPQTKNGLRRMSLNSFGVSGTNAHIVMEDAFHFLQEHGFNAPHKTHPTPKMPIALASKLALTNGTHANGKLENGVNGVNGTNGINGVNGHHINGNGTNGTHGESTPQLFVLSSQDQDGISRLCNVYKDRLPSLTDSLHDLSFTLAAKRTHFNWRTAIVADSIESLQDALSEKQPATRVATDSGLAFVFTGQGAQWARMGTGLMQYPIFRQSIEAADAYLKTLGCNWSVTWELSKLKDQSRINEAEFSQPLCTAVQVALVDLLDSFGVSPQAVAGHSSGEIAAAYAIGAISNESAWKISYWRGYYSAKLARTVDQPKTTMAAVGLDFDKSIKYIQKINKTFEGVEKLAVACMNSKDSHTISGDTAQIDALVQALNEEKIFARKLTVEMAYHSKYMEPMSAQYAKAMGEIQSGEWKKAAPQPQFFSSTYGNLIDPSKLQEAAYWTKNLVNPVRFHESVTAMLQATTASNENGDSPLITDILEVGPHAALKGPLRNIVDEVRGGGAVKYHNVLRRGESDHTSILLGAGSLFARGLKIDLVKVNFVEDLKPKMMIGLPRYPFNHSKEYWYESRLSRNFRNRPYARHELLGAPVNDWDGKHDAVWRNWIRLSENPWVEHHTISGAILYPAAGMLVMAIEGCRQLAETSNPGKPIKGFRFKEVSFHAALRVPDDSMGIESHLYLRPVKQAALESKPSPWKEFQICTAQDDDEWREHCRGQILVEYEEAKTIVDGGLEDELLQKLSNESLDAAKEKCTTQLEAQKIYDAWRDVGLVFGPTFQTVSDPCVDHESGKAFAKVNSTVPLLKTLMPKEYVQPHLIHPTTLDGALQVCLAPLISNPDRKQTNAIVLTFVDELWVSGSEHPEDGYLVCADTEPNGRKEYAMTCTAVEPTSRQPMVLVKGLIVTEVDGDESSSKQEDDPKSKSWHIDWKPDTELLSAEDIKNAFVAADGLKKYLDALAHKNPSMKILKLGKTEALTTKDILGTLGERFVQLDVTDTSLEALDAEKSRLSDDRVQFQVLKFEEDLSSQGFETATYDSVVAGKDVSERDLTVILTLLKQGGKLILESSENNVAEQLTRSGFSGIDASFQDESLLLVVSSVASETAEEAQEPASDSSYYLVTADNPASELQRKVSAKIYSELLALGHPAKSVTLSQYNQIVAVASPERIANSTCILLPELEAGLLTSLNKEKLQALKSVMNSKKLIWVNKDGSPDTDLVTGFATCIRLERPELKFVVLTFQPESSVDTIAAKILEVDTAVTKGTTETSYKVVDGITNIPRLVEATALTQHIKKQTLAAEAVDAAFGADPSRSLRLQIQEIGLLDTLCFNDDPLHVTPLAETDVEFKTMATAVNFKDLAVMLGKIKETPVGLEAAGVVTRVGSGVTRFKEGDRVFGFAFKGGFSTHVRALEGTIAHIPDNLSFTEAAVIPIVYTTAYACLYDIGELDRRTKRGSKTTVLIHAAAGGVGQAAIQLEPRFLPQLVA